MTTTSTPEPLLRILARKAMLRARWSDLVDWAIDALVQGSDSPSLRILAGLSAPVFPREVEHYFQRTLDEFGWTIPGEEALLRWYATDNAQRILADEIPAASGCAEIYHVYVALEYPHWLSEWGDCEFDLHSGEPLEGDALTTSVKEAARAFLARTACG